MGSCRRAPCRRSSSSSRVSRRCSRGCSRQQPGAQPMPSCASRHAAAAGAERAGNPYQTEPAAAPPGPAARADPARGLAVAVETAAPPVAIKPDELAMRARRLSGFFYCARITHIMSASPPVVRGGEYAARGDYHREPDPSWDYYPTYLAKLDGGARGGSNALPAGRASSTPAAARACSSTSSPAAWPSKASTRTTRRRACAPAR